MKSSATVLWRDFNFRHVLPAKLLRPRLEGPEQEQKPVRTAGKQKPEIWNSSLSLLGQSPYSRVWECSIGVRVKKRLKPCGVCCLSISKFRNLNKAKQGGEGLSYQHCEFHSPPWATSRTLCQNKKSKGYGCSPVAEHPRSDHQYCQKTKQINKLPLNWKADSKKLTKVNTEISNSTNSDKLTRIPALT